MVLTTHACAMLEVTPRLYGITEGVLLGVETKTLAILVAATMSAVGILGDYFLKRASEAPQPLATRSFLIGFVLYASTAVAWTFVMRHLTLATIGVIYAMCMILLLALMGVVVFDEPLHRTEIVGIVLALAALILLARFG
jgi:multidrug transporter EmrE-like cation transporter